GTPGFTPGSALEILDYKIYAWPGYGIPEDASGWQYLEGEYMTADEYDEFILDPSDFWLRKYLPRVFGSFEPLKKLQTLTNFTENVHLGQILAPLSTPPMQEMLKKMLKAGAEYQKARKVAAKYMGMSLANGFPMMGSVFCKAPFDTIGDTLRGTSGIIMDMYRCPDKLLKALDVVADLTIHTAKNAPGINRAVQAGYPLHKGADGWMSQEQFDTFYWPSLKKVMDALIEEGLIQRLFAEGGFNTRLEAVNQFDKGFVTWYFDRSDMALVKKELGDKCCIQGNIPIGLLIAGTPEEVKEHCRQLIETCGKGGGYIMAAGTAGSGAKLENLRAMLEAVKEYGFYR
ncbi:uroporphyrinogen decarboxylase family protein, partial [Chloroflexota bacterium]